MSAVSNASRNAASDLGSLLGDLEPGRWPGAQAAAERLRAVKDVFGRLVERTFPEGEEELRERLAAVWDVLGNARPDTLDAWLEFRRRCEPQLEALVSVLSQEPEASVRRPTNLVRSAYHVANALGVVLLVEMVLPDSDAWRIGVSVAGATAAWGMEISRWWWPAVNERLMAVFRPVAHPHEARTVNSATWYTTAVLCLALFFPVSAGAAGLMALGLGDPAAALVGRRFGRHRLANGRSLEGAAAFVVAGFVGAFWVLSVFHPAPPDVLVVQALSAALAGALAELFVRKIDDNLAIPLAGALAVALVSAFGG